jgi:Leucine-rich repeat (LRR) protein
MAIRYDYADVEHLICLRSDHPFEKLMFLTKMKNLKTIEANSCGIEEIDYDLKDCLFLYHLHTVDLSNNHIGTIKEHCFYTLQHGLKTLDLSNNTITHIAPEAFYHLTRLESLDLSSNNISFINQTSFKDLLRMKNFSIADNNLLILDFHQFRNSFHLQTLNFRNNNIRTLNYSESIWQNMTVLDLSNNPIDNLDFKISNQFPKLQNFTLNIQCDSDTPIKFKYLNFHLEHSCKIFGDPTNLTNHTNLKDLTEKHDQLLLSLIVISSISIVGLIIHIVQFSSI